MSGANVAPLDASSDIAPNARPGRWRAAGFACLLAGGALGVADRLSPLAAPAPGAFAPESTVWGSAAKGPESAASATDIDHDRDGVASVADALPFLDTEQIDSDGDGFGDSQDRFPDDPTRARPVELLANGTFDAGIEGWTTEGIEGAAAFAPHGGIDGSGALGLAGGGANGGAGERAGGGTDGGMDGGMEGGVDGGEPPAWVGERVAVEPDSVALRVGVSVRGRNGVELRFAVHHRDPLGTSTVARSVVLPGSLDDGWRDHDVEIELPSRPVWVRPSVLGAGGAVLIDELSLQAERATDADDDGIDDRVDPDDDGDGYLDGEDPAPLDPKTGPKIELVVKQATGPATGPKIGPKIGPRIGPESEPAGEPNTGPEFGPEPGTALGAAPRLASVVELD